MGVPAIRNFLMQITVPNLFGASGIRVLLCLLIFTINIAPQYLHAEQASPRVVRYPASDSNPYYYKRVKYFVEVLDLALSKSDHQYKLQKLSLPFMNESRSRTNLTTDVYDVHWLNAQAFLDSNLQPVRIPLCKGLTGWRILFIRPESQADFSSVKNLNDLKKHIAGHGNDWPEAALYENQELPQRLSSSWKGLFYMLKLNRVDYVSRSALEIYDEENAFPELNLKIESQLVLNYPAAYYFYVKKTNQSLASDIEIGLERSIKDGSFDKLFNRYFGDKIKQLKLENRQIIQIPAPGNIKLLSDKKAHPSYWYARQLKEE